MAHYHEARSVQWGHWGIDFLDMQPDRTKNFGIIVARISFPVGNCGPIDGHLGSAIREDYQRMVARWIESRVIPSIAQVF